VKLRNDPSVPTFKDALFPEAPPSSRSLIEKLFSAPLSCGSRQRALLFSLFGSGKRVSFFPRCPGRSIHQDFFSFLAVQRGVFSQGSPLLFFCECEGDFPPGPVFPGAFRPISFSSRRLRSKLRNVPFPFPLSNYVGRDDNVISVDVSCFSEIVAGPFLLTLRSWVIKFGFFPPGGERSLPDIN